MMVTLVYKENVTLEGQEGRADVMTRELSRTELRTEQQTVEAKEHLAIDQLGQNLEQSRDIDKI